MARVNSNLHWRERTDERRALHTHLRMWARRASKIDYLFIEFNPMGLTLPGLAIKSIHIDLLYIR